MDEIWKDIEGFEGLYQVSNLGNVKSLVDSNGVSREKIRKPSICSNGYLQVILYKNKTIKHFSVHRLVAIAFIPNPNNLPCVNHIDECKTNNVASNLEWCTHKENINYGSRNERASKAISKKVGAFKNGELVLTFPSTREAGRQGFCQFSVSACCRGERNSHKGYEWRYL